MTDKTTKRAPIPCADVNTLLAYEAGRLDTLYAVLKSSKTTTREMLIQWVEAEIAKF